MLFIGMPISYFKISFIITFFLCLYSCQEAFEPEGLDDEKRMIVVDGHINNLSGSYAVRLSWASPYDYDYVDYIHGAIVVISDDEGNKEILQENDLGIYKSSGDGLIGRIGSKYQLSITMPDGKVYASTPAVMKQAPEISIDASIGKEYGTRNNYYGDLITFEYDGISVFINVDTQNDEQGFFMFKTKYYRQMYNPSPSPPRCIEHVGFQKELNIRAALPVGPSYEIRHHKIRFFPYDKYCKGWVALVNIYSLNKEAYSYYQSVNDQLLASERIFDPVPTQINGNIKCLNDSSKSALGLFEVASVTTKYAAFFWDGPDECHMKILDDDYDWPLYNSCDWDGYVNHYWIDP